MLIIGCTVFQIYHLLSTRQMKFLKMILLLRLSARRIFLLIATMMITITLLGILKKKSMYILKLLKSEKNILHTLAVELKSIVKQRVPMFFRSQSFWEAIQGRICMQLIKFPMKTKMRSTLWIENRLDFNLSEVMLHIQKIIYPIQNFLRKQLEDLKR